MSYPTNVKPPTHLVWAILSTLFCCLPFGVVSIVFAAQVDSKWSAGDMRGAREYSDKAKNWAIAAAAIGLASIVLGACVALSGGDA